MNGCPLVQILSQALRAQDRRILKGQVGAAFIEDKPHIAIVYVYDIIKPS